MSFEDNDSPWWDDLDDDVSDDVRRILEERTGDDDIEPEDIEESEEEFEDIESVDLDDLEDDPHNAPENEADTDWEHVHHFDFGEDARNYCEGVPAGILYIVYNDDGSADVYVDRDYEGASV